jgi:prephenate dehydrogenase
MARRATIVGTGLIGGSVGIALRKQGWRTSAVDVDADTAAEALHIGAADQIGYDPECELVVVAAPVSAIPELVGEALERTSAVVTDVGSTKAEICRAVTDPRFIGGHPMAGSEQDGIAGARDDLFSGAMWVLTPLETTDESAFASVRAVVRSLGAESLALPPAVHDELVAQVSHVPHLAAATMMNLADTTAIEHRALLRLAAGGFRDMTRISAGRPSIWPDICVANSAAIVKGLDQMIEALSTMRGMVAGQDADGILQLLTTARAARVNLPVGFGPADNPVELAIPIPDRPGEIAAIATLAAELDVNIYDLEISHSVEGRQGVMVAIVDEARSERFVGGLMARGYRPTVRSFE